MYAVYLGNSGGLAHDGKPVPLWSEAKTAVQGHWVAVADDVLELFEYRNGFNPNQVPASFEGELREDIFKRYIAG